MRILIVTQYFAPELTAASIRLSAVADGLAAAGHEVQVLCEVPNHPNGVIEPDYKGRFVVSRDDAGYRVKHVWVHASPSKRARSRILSYASYSAVATAVGSTLRRPDAIVASSPPLTVGPVGWALAKRFRVPWVLDVRDLWPEVAVALGELEEGRVLRTAEGLERWLYARADAITTPTEPFRAHIAQISPDPGKVHVVGNGTDRRWLEAGRMEPDREAAGLPADRFVWTYAGNLGLSQNLETAIEAAEILGDGYELLLLGDGTTRPALEARAATCVRGRVTFRDSVPATEAMVIMRASDALLVSLADRPELGRSIPIKLYDSCAVGRPVILAAPGEPRRIAAEAEAALIVDPGSPQGLADAVRGLASSPEEAAALAGRGIDFAERNLRELGVARLAEVLTGIVDG